MYVTLPHFRVASSLSLGLGSCKHPIDFSYNWKSRPLDQWTTSVHYISSPAEHPNCPGPTSTLHVELWRYILYKETSISHVQSRCHQILTYRRSIHPSDDRSRRCLKLDLYNRYKQPTNKIEIRIMYLTSILYLMRQAPVILNVRLHPKNVCLQANIVGRRITSGTQWALTSNLWIANLSPPTELDREICRVGFNFYLYCKALLLATTLCVIASCKHNIYYKNMYEHE